MTPEQMLEEHGTYIAVRCDHLIPQPGTEEYPDGYYRIVPFGHESGPTGFRTEHMPILDARLTARVIGKPIARTEPV